MVDVMKAAFAQNGEDLEEMTARGITPAATNKDGSCGRPWFVVRKELLGE